MLRHILVVCLVAMSRPDGRRSCSTWPQDVGLMPGGSGASRAARGRTWAAPDAFVTGMESLIGILLAVQVFYW